jgi:hypothetical protein
MNFIKQKLKTMNKLFKIFTNIFTNKPVNNRRADIILLSKVKRISDGVRGKIVSDPRGGDDYFLILYNDGSSHFIPYDEHDNPCLQTFKILK